MTTTPRQPLRFGEDPLLWASWLYYQEGLTQGDIATQMGVSRASVNAYLADARTRGIVSIEIDPERFRALSLAQAMQDHFGLTDCLVIPSEGGDSPLIDRLGAAAAQVLSRLARSADTIAVTWGRTVLSMASRVDRTGLQDLRVVRPTCSAAWPSAWPRNNPIWPNWTERSAMPITAWRWPGALPPRRAPWARRAGRTRRWHRG